MEQKNDSPAAETKAAEETSAQIVTDPKATIKIEGQEFDLDAVLAQEDQTLKTVLQPHFSSIEGANITREIKEGKLTVTIVKRPQYKGMR
ncbi:MAG: hypothetical protein KF855_11945 [Acidobacteria bacterium]|nr:hypothetical protein [Acidobacteriota bacterium]